MENSYEQVSGHLQKMLMNLSLCEKNRIQEMSLVSNRLCFIWISSIIFLYLCIVFYYYKLSQKINFTWKIYFRKSIIAFPFIKGLLINRLLTTHNFSFLADTEKLQSKKTFKDHKFWVRYSLVTLAVVIVGVLIVILFVYNYGLNIYISLEYRKNFIEIPLNRRICVLNYLEIIKKMVNYLYLYY